MTQEDICFTPATRLAKLIAAREVSPVEATDAVLARAETLQPRLNLFATLMADSARETARAAEQAVMRGDALGPLHGVPITIKDNLAVAGVPMANGSAAFADFVPARDATVVARVRSAGAIIIGKTNLPEFAHKVLTDSPAFDVTRNPWSLDHTPGGSSGGTSAALAAGVAPLSLGTDGGGSIRCPAACTNTVGLKATLGRIPFESLPDGFANFAFVGPMARTVDDVSLLLGVLEGPDAADPFSIAATTPTEMRAPRDPGKLRIGWIEHFGPTRTEAETAALTTETMRVLERAGMTVEPLHEPLFDDVFARYVVLATTAHAARFGHLVARFGDRLSASIRASIARGQTYSAVDWQRAHDFRTSLFRAVQTLFDRFDLIATPTMTGPPRLLDAEGSIATDEYAEWAAPLYPFNLSSHPAISVPAGFTTAGLPVGLQLVGPWFGERLLLDVAALLERTTGWTERRPVG
jgi:aspartyl-tRNA(Asn)/glutamyl-tRNA(Gln) amidotransferase subunit A